MRILVDGRSFSSKKRGTGIASHTRSLTEALQAEGCDVDMLFEWPLKKATSKMQNNLLGPLSKEIGNFIVRLRNFVRQAYAPKAVILPKESSYRNSGIPLPSFNQALYSPQIYKRAKHFFIDTHKLVPLALPQAYDVMHWSFPIPIKAQKCPNIYTIHDLIPLQFPQFVVKNPCFSMALHQEIANQADLIITVSDYAKHHIMKLLNVPEERVFNTYQPVPHLSCLSRHDAEKIVEKHYGLAPDSYGLFIGAIEPKKNISRLVAAHMKAAPKTPLLLAGPLGWLYGDDLKLIAELNKSAGAGSTPIRLLGYIDRLHITALLRCAKFLTFPSIAEGFGLPVLEALQLGVPVLTSNTASLPEVAGEAAILIDPLDEAALEAGILRLDQDKDLRHMLAQAGPAQAAKFSKEAYRKKLAQAYSKVGVHF